MLPRTRRRAAREGRQRQRRGVGSPIETGLLSSFLKLKTTRYLKEKTELLQIAASELFVGAETFNAWRRGTRPIPRTKQLRLTAIVKKKYGINLKTA